MTSLNAPALLIGYGMRCAARRTPDKIALSDLDGNHRSYKALVDRIGRIGTAVRDGFHLAKGDRVALIAPNVIEYAECTLGLAEAGLAVVTLNPGSTDHEIRYILDHARAKLALCHDSVGDGVRAVTDVPVVTIGTELDALVARAAPSGPWNDVRADDIFCISYTSGTTGKPKGVMLSHRARSYMFALGLAGSYGAHTPDTRALAISPFFNGGGLAHLLAPLYFGGSSVVAGRFEPERTRAALATDISFAAFVPTQLTAMLDLGPWPAMPRLDTLVTNSSAAPHALKERLTETIAPARLFDSYGSTECGMVAGVGPANMLERPGTIGRPIPGAQVRLTDPAGADVAAGEIGEVACRSPWLFSGYLDDPAATAAAVKDGWCLTGDLARFDDDGFLFAAGRSKQVIISGGQNVFPAEIENALADHPAIREVAVVGVPHSYWGEAVTAAYSLKPNVAPPSGDDLKQFLKQRLSGYKVPKQFTELPDLPKNATGKIQHSRVMDLLAARDGRAEKPS